MIIEEKVHTCRKCQSKDIVKNGNYLPSHVENEIN